MRVRRSRVWPIRDLAHSSIPRALSVGPAIIERMFEPMAPDALLLQRVCSASRAEACAAAARLVAIGELVSLRMAQDGCRSDDWAVDAVDEVAIEVGAALGISRGLAASHIRYAHALRVQLPLVGRAFIAGDIDEATFRTLVFRTALIVDDDVLARIDEQLALRVPRWGSMSRSQLASRIDKIIARVDLDAVRRRRDRITGREVLIGDVDNGMAEIHATVFAPVAHAFADRLTALAHTVCETDPRSIAERRADAFGVIGAGGDRLACHCNLADCPAAARPPASAVVIHVIAEQSTIDGTGHTPAAMIGYDGLIPAELVAELANAARLRPLIHPADSAPEAGYTPTRALADFVRCRDLTCRFPGCNHPATAADIDHTIPYGDGGPTHASNLKCLCRHHHLLKTFWGWHDEQLPDATVIWTSPAGARYITTPGSALIFPNLTVPTEAIVPAPRRTDHPGDRTAMMPRRPRTRAQQRTAAITAERRANHQRHTTPPRQPVVPDEYLEYEDTFTKEPIPPPF
jgi:Domain of unknown function (DUF222)